MSNAYHITIYTGDRPDFTTIASCRLNAKEITPEGALEALRESKLNSADLRSKALFYPSSSSKNVEAVLLYTALMGYAGRKLDLTDGSKVYEPENISFSVNKDILDGQNSPNSTELVVIGPELSRESGTEVYININENLSLEHKLLIKNSKSVALDLTGTETIMSVLLFISIAALRKKNNIEKLPDLLVNSEILSLEDVRKTCNELRRASRTDDRDAIVDRVAIAERELSLSNAADVAIEKTLALLGSQQNEETGYWRCPRPSRHKNGDANPSLKVQEGKVRCYRCDQEHLDSLRLVMDSLGCGPDDAAKILLEFQRTAPTV
ncbi:MAG: hypothetical protein ACKOW9_03485 [Candidatus Paceibacterota bacterium]